MIVCFWQRRFVALFCPFFELHGLSAIIRTKIDSVREYVPPLCLFGTKLGMCEHETTILLKTGTPTGSSISIPTLGGTIYCMPTHFYINHDTHGAPPTLGCNCIREGKEEVTAKCFPETPRRSEVCYFSFILEYYFKNIQ